MDERVKKEEEELAGMQVPSPHSIIEKGQASLFSD